VKNGTYPHADVLFQAQNAMDPVGELTTLPTPPSQMRMGTTPLFPLPTTPSTFCLSFSSYTHDPRSPRSLE